MAVLTNREIIENTLMLSGSDFEYDGNNLKTFLEWKKAGYKIRKGEKAFLKLDLWKPFKHTEVKEGEEDTVTTRFRYKTSHLFHSGQVERMVTPNKGKSA